MLQVRAAGLLAQLYVQRGAFERAAAVHEALALRRSGPGHGEEATLQQRVDSLRDAVLQVVHTGTAGFIGLVSIRSRLYTYEFDGELLQHPKVASVSHAASWRVRICSVPGMQPWGRGLDRQPWEPPQSSWTCNRQVSRIEHVLGGRVS